MLMLTLGTLNAGINWLALTEFLSAWEWPRGVKPPHREFMDAPINDEGMFKAQGSACLNLYPLLRLFLTVYVMPILGGRMQECVDSMLNLCGVLDMLLRTRECTCTPDELEKAIMDHLRGFKRAYARLLKYFIPKFHMSAHLSEYYRRFGILLALFTHERKHRTVKKYLSDRKYTGSYERGQTEHLTIEHLHGLRICLLRAGLISPSDAEPAVEASVRALWPDAEHVKVSQVATVKSRTFTAGDVILFRDGSNFGVGELWFHAQADDHEPFSCISTWAEDLPMRDKYTRTCRQVDAPQFLPSEDLRASLVRRDAADSIVQVVIPAEFWS